MPQASVLQQRLADVYRLLTGDPFWLIAVHFDTTPWADDPKAQSETCRAKEVPDAPDRSKRCTGGGLPDTGRRRGQRRQPGVQGAREGGKAGQMRGKV